MYEQLNGQFKGSESILKTICYVCNKREAVIIENDTDYICAKCKLIEI